MKRALRRLYYRGAAVHCPACGGSFRRFRPAGTPPRPNAKCPACGARERDRFAALFLRARSDLRHAQPLRLLHVAPEASVAGILRSWSEGDYLSADIRPGKAMATMDIARIDRPDDSFDGIWCSHVLEHVPDDGAAMAEFFRVLAPGGWAVIGVPIAAPETFEDPSVTSPSERLRLFGQEDHVRRYGPDVIGRLRGAGFAVEVVRPSEVETGSAERRRCRLPGDDQPLFVCRKDGHGR
ncbi:MAG: methyltransferase domain-containing protein [Gemmatimonadota bacterium]